MQLEPGMRVRCVSDGWYPQLKLGEEYIIDSLESYERVKIIGTGTFYADRFKPIVRVRAVTCPA